ncbi:MAG: hypothetical protein U0324_14555 [Polyangiales bacterium]
MTSPRRSAAGRTALPCPLPAPHPRAWAALLVALVVALPAIAGAQETPPARAPASTDSLVPFFLLAVAIERFWETFFTVVEGGMVTTGRVLGSFSKPLQSLVSELEASRREVAALSEKLVGKAVADPAYAAARAEIVRAEQRLERARNRVVLVTRSPVYVSIKRSVILIGSLVLGPLVARSSGLHLFQALGVTGMKPDFDEMLTGLIIGTGSEPTHNLLGALGGLRAALCSLAELPRRMANGAAGRAADDAREDAADEAPRGELPDR